MQGQVQRSQIKHLLKGGEWQHQHQMQNSSKNLYWTQGSSLTFEGKERMTIAHNLVKEYEEDWKQYDQYEHLNTLDTIVRKQ